MNRVLPRTLEKEAPMQLRMSTRHVEGVMVVDCSGRVVFGEESASLRDTIKKLLAEPREERVRRLRGDLEDTCFIGASTGLFEGRLRARAETPLRICGSSSRGRD